MRQFLKRAGAAALLACALVRPAAAATCDGSGTVVNGFEGLTSTCEWAGDIKLWTLSPGTTLMPITQGAGTNQVIDGNQYGRFTWSGAVPQNNITMNAPYPVGTNWAAYNYLQVACATTDTSGVTGVYTTSMYLNTVADGSVQFVAAQTNIIAAGPVVTVPNWTYLILSLNYVKNLGMSPGNVAAVELEEDDFPAPGGGTGVMSFDYLKLSSAAPTPNSPVNVTQYASSVGCGSLALSWTAQTAAGADALAGYHIYRSTSGASGPWVSVAYVPLGTNNYTDAFSDTSVATSYYEVLPYSSQTTAFGGGASGYYLGCGASSIDPAWASGFGGVNEALLSPAFAFALNASSGCPPTPTFSPTKSQTATPTVSPSSTRTPTGTVTPTASPTPTPTLTFTDTMSFTASPTNSPSPAGTLTITPTITDSPNGTLTNTPTFSYSPTVTVTLTLTLTWTNTPFVSATPTPTNTAVVYSSNTQIYPNPFYPDQGQVFHIGNVSPGDTMTIYNMIGQLVYSLNLKGNPQVDVWNGVNNNGVEVVTGIYFLVLGGSRHETYRVAVVRGSK